MKSRLSIKMSHLPQTKLKEKSLLTLGKPYLYIEHVESCLDDM